MGTTVQHVVVLGGGSAGLMAALAVRRAFPALQVTVVHSPDVPVIGVGESTTVLFPQFIHQSLGISPAEFFAAVCPGWKLGIRFLWGDPRDTHFDYPFDGSMGNKPAMLSKMPAYYGLDNDRRDVSRCAALMDRGLSPCFLNGSGEISVTDAFGYHVENRPLIELLTDVGRRYGVTFRAAHVAHVHRDETGRVTELQMADGTTMAGDLFIDASGFDSRLLQREFGVRRIAYDSSLFCDTAVVGRWDRQSPFLPYTTAETMDAGWCWQIEFPQHVTRGYVFSSAFCSREAAEQEFRVKNPQLAGGVRFLSFPSFRLESFWQQNVVAVGNAAGFTEPLEATALHLVIEEVRLLCRVLSEGDGEIIPALVRAANRRFGQLWDEVRDFLAVHYRFNQRSNSPFWAHCRQHVDLAGATELVSFYQEAGPSSLAAMLIPGGHVFGYDGFMNLLVGQRVPTRFASRLDDAERQRWNRYRESIRQQISPALPMEVAYPRLAAAWRSARI